MMMTPEHLMVVMPSWIGDIVMATPALRALKEAHPKMRITATIRPGLRPASGDPGGGEGRGRHPDRRRPGAPAGADPNDPTGAGGGTIGTGQAPTPGEQGFSGNAQQQQGPNTQPPQAGGQQQPPMGSVQ